MTIQAPTMFPFRHDWDQPFKVTREWKTDIQTANDGSELRVQLRANPNIAMAMRVASLTEMIPGRLLAQWRGASQPLRYYAPLWCDVTDLTDPVTAGDAIITLDTTTRPFFDLSPSGIGYAMLWRSEEFAEVVSYHELDDTLIVLDAGTVNGYAVAGTRVIPCRPMWLTLPVNVTWLNGRIAQVDLSFVEQKEQAGLGLDGTDTTATPASVQIYKKDWGTYGQGSAGFVPYVLDVEAMPFDALGVPLPSAAIAWTSHVTSGTAVTVTPSSNSRFARVFVNAAGGNITATAAGGISSTMSVN
jgi:hypothetical protein